MIPILLALLSGPALAEDPAPPPADEATAPTLQVGPVISVAHKEVVGIGELELSPCVARAAAVPVQPPVATGGAVELRVTLKRGKVRLVTTTTVDEGLEWLTPCLERQLAAHSWPLKQGVLDVPVTLGAPGEMDRGTAP